MDVGLIEATAIANMTSLGPLSGQLNGGVRQVIPRDTHPHERRAHGEAAASTAHVHDPSSATLLEKYQRSFHPLAQPLTLQISEDGDFPFPGLP